MIFYILLILLIIVMFTSKTTEHMTQQQQLLNVDIESIKNLSQIATKLMTDNESLTNPGSLNITKNLTVGNDKQGSLNFLPKGSIIAFYGNIIPLGWRICDGNNGTPDLRGRFILGEGQGTGLTNRIMGQTGGEESVTLTINQMPSHSHNISSDRRLPGWNEDEIYRSNRDRIYGYKRDGESSTNTLELTNTGGNRPHNNMPPYYILKYIMRVL